MTGAEREVLERDRTSPDALSRAMAALLLDGDHAAARAHLAEATTQLRRYLARSQLPGAAGYSPCGIATIAACHVLSAAPAERTFDDLRITFEPAVTSIRWRGCGPRAVPVANGLVAFLMADAALASRSLERAWPEGVLDELVARTIKAMLVPGDVGAILTELAPRYRAAMAKGLWRDEPDAFLHVRLLAALLVGAERGLVDLAALPDDIPYAPVAFVAYVRGAEA